MAKIIHVDMPRSSEHSKRTDKEETRHYNRMRNAVSDSRRKKAPVTLPSVKSFDHE
jgi:hypothetical protein